ncbi:ComEA family DNA-binding protein [Leptolyngbya cf. ectocarpi LEGE 11479]|uniref:ComEA family DNA-binding protein n=1 Tax=Leptolyngbya cf. ectocarpi LEGE 11479 TaxID=1828722 RepID=A0A928ZX12_LEPEC|nr:ComEA family DNA-binding protein [Leptolyngbya ectocarpi]MBE9068995.1 ComEA family DNA-binding protein [Leptolyngbya cf. ectocarpi LEGE 11479]
MARPGPIWRLMMKQALRGLDVLEARLNPLKKTLAQDSYYRFRSADEVQLGVKSGVRIDANRATIDDWLRLPGISIHQARALVELSHSGISLTCWEDVAVVTGIGLHHLQAFGEMVQFYYYDPESAVTPRQLNVNQASVEELTVLVDRSLAERLVYYRQRWGPYQGWLDLKHRLQLPPDVVTKLLHYLRF